MADRLNALDAAFLHIEEGGAHMHIGALGIFEGGELVDEKGSVDFERIEKHVEGALDRIPRYRQIVTSVPGIDGLAWVDDPHFRLKYHVRHTALPKPGTERQLKRLAGRVFGQRLNREHPLWELWVVEGLEPGDDGEPRFALVMKTHHALVDGMGGARLLAEMFGRQQTTESVWTPEVAPSKLALLEKELKHRVGSAKEQLEGLREAFSNPKATLAGARDAILQSRELVRSGLMPSSTTPLNPKAVGPHRRFDGVRLELGDVKRVKRALGGKVNDVILATAAGGLRRYFARRDVDAGSFDEFRVMIPVDIRHGFSGVGNRVGMLFAQLPLGEEDPLRRYEEVVAQTTRAKTAAGFAKTTEALEKLTDWAAPSMLSQVFKYAAWVGSFNLVITNVPGPQFPLRLHGARLVSIFPLVPLFTTQALGIALFSYDGGIYWGLNADWSHVDDLHLLADDLRTSFDELATHA